MLKTICSNFIGRVFFVFCTLFIFYACASNHDIKPAEEPIKITNPIEEISFSIIKNIASTYYKYPDKRRIDVKIDRFVSNITSPALFAYFRDGIEEKLKNAPQIVLHKKNKTCLDAKIEIDVLFQQPDTILVALSILDAKTSLRIHAEQQQFTLNEVEHFSKLNRVEEPLEVGRKQQRPSRNASITVKADYIGKTYKEEDRYFLNTRYDVYGRVVERWVSKYDTGYSGYYPVDMKVEFSGRTYTPDHNYVFFEGNILPGRWTFIASFRGGKWDNIARRQYAVEGEYKKKFMVNVNEGDRLRVDVAFGYSGSIQEIIVRVSRVKTVYQHGSVQEALEVIEVFR